MDLAKAFDEIDKGKSIREVSKESKIPLASLWRQYIRYLEFKTATVEKKLQELEAQKTELEKQIADRRNHLEELKLNTEKRLEQLEKENAELKAQLQEFKKAIADLSRVNKEIEAKRKVIDVLTEQEKALKLQLDRLGAILERVKATQVSEVETLEKRRTELEQIINNLNSHFEKLSYQITATRSELDQLESRAKSIDQKVSELRSRLNEALYKLDEALSKLQQIEGEKKKKWW